MNLNDRLPVYSDEGNHQAFFNNFAQHEPKNNTKPSTYEAPDQSLSINFGRAAFTPSMDFLYASIPPPPLYPYTQCGQHCYYTMQTGIEFSTPPTVNFGQESCLGEGYEPNASFPMPSAAFDTGFPNQIESSFEQGLTRNPEVDQPNGTTGTPHHEEAYRCRWEGCQYIGTFGRSTELKRHVETQHISPSSFKCIVPECGKSYNREDNLNSHVWRVHRSKV